MGFPAFLQLVQPNLKPQGRAQDMYYAQKLQPDWDTSGSMSNQQLVIC
jgi:hypothetical protein